MKLHPLDVFNDDVDSLLNGIGISEDIRVSVAQFQQLLGRIVDHINFQHKLREILKNLFRLIMSFVWDRVEGAEARKKKQYNKPNEAYAYIFVCS